MSHRALLFAAMADGRSRVTGLAGGDDVGRTRRALDQLGVAITDRAAPAVVDRRPRRRRVHRARRRRRLRQLGHDASGCSPACSRAVRSSVDAHRRRVAGAATDGAASSSRCGRWARASTAAPTAPCRRSSCAAATSSACAHQLAVASAQVKTALRARRAAGRRHHRDRRARAQPRPHRAHARRPRRAGHPGRRTRGPGHRGRARRRSSSRCPATRRRPRSGWWRRPSRPARSSSSRTSPCNPARIAFVDVLRAHGRGDRDRRHRRAAGRAGRRAAGHERAAARHHRRGRGDPVGDRRDPGAGGRGGLRRGRHRVPRRRRAAGEGERPHRHRRRAAHAGSASASSSGDDHLVVRGGRPQPGEARQPRRPPHRHGRRRSRPARSRARPGCAAGGAVASVVPRVHRTTSPRSPGGRARDRHGVVAIDGPAGSGKSTVARGVAAALGLPDARHRRDVPRRGAGRARRAASTSTTPTRWPTVARAAAIELEHGVVDARRARRRPPRSAGREVTGGGVAGVGAIPRCERCSSSVSAAWVAQHGGGVVEGRDIGTVVLARRAAEGVHHRARRGACRPPSARRGRGRAHGRGRRRCATRSTDRDRADGTLGRATRPEDAAPDAIVIDTSDVTAEEVDRRDRRARAEAFEERVG